MVSKAQSSDTSLKGRQIQYEELTRQRINQRNAGIILWAAGNIIGTIGTVYEILSLGDNKVAEVAMVAGMGMVVTGVGLLVSSWVKKKKAKALLRASTSKIEFNGRNYVTPYSVGIAIAL